MKLVGDIETFYNDSLVKRFFYPGQIYWGTGSRYSFLDSLDHNISCVIFVDEVFNKSEFMGHLQQKLNNLDVHVITKMPDTQNIAAILEKNNKPPKLVVSLGGGSTVDTAKAVIASWIFGDYRNVGVRGGPSADLVEGVVKPELVAIPSTAGTGAEASRYFVVYDSITKAKVFGRSWLTVADKIILDSYFLENSPSSLILVSAFDAFLHLFESYVCRNECSWFGRMLSLDSIPKLILAVANLDTPNFDDNDRLALLYSSTVGGVAISNVRTGNIHEAAGALLEYTDLSHGETLCVFTYTAIEQYSDAIEMKSVELLKRINDLFPERGMQFNSILELCEWWEAKFRLHGLQSRIHHEVSKLDSVNLADCKSLIRRRLENDEVWRNKESPVLVGLKEIEELIELSFDRVLGKK